MTKKLVNLTNHQLTQEQINDAIKNLRISEIVELPSYLKKMYSMVDPYIEKLRDTGLFKELTNFLKKNTDYSDFVLIQGEFGISFLLIQWCFMNGRTPIYATTFREVTEEKQEDGTTIKKTKFKHVQFRRYELL